MVYESQIQEAPFQVLFPILEHQNQLKGIKKVDLFEDFLDIIPHLSPETTNNFFQAAGLGYIPTLAYASFLCLQYSGFTHLRNDPEGSFKIDVDKYGAKRIIQAKLIFKAGKKDKDDYKDSNYSSVMPYPSSRVFSILK